MIDGDLHEGAAVPAVDARVTDVEDHPVQQLGAEVREVDECDAGQRGAGDGAWAVGLGHEVLDCLVGAVDGAKDAVRRRRLLDLELLVKGRDDRLTRPVAVGVAAHPVCDEEHGHAREHGVLVDLAHASDVAGGTHAQRNSFLRACVRRSQFSIHK